MRTSTSLLATILVIGMGPGHSAMALADPSATLYRLGDQATFEAGCLAPCMCPVSARGSLKGTLTLEPAGFDGVFQNYRVAGIDWRLVRDQVQTPVTGSGSYRVGGDRQQLTLDLSVDGAPAQRYDSGLIGGGASFPSLSLPVALHGFYCNDSVYGVQATPGVTGVLPLAVSNGPLRLGPNPFHGRAGIAFEVASTGPVDLRIHDLAGREVRALLSGAVLEAGPHTLVWDGLRGDGAKVPPGVYFVRLKTPGRESGGALVKL